MPSGCPEIKADVAAVGDEAEGQAQAERPAERAFGRAAGGGLPDGLDGLRVQGASLDDVRHFVETHYK